MEEAARYLEIQSTESKNARLTLNPNTGRVTLKVPKNTPENISNAYKNLANMLLLCYTEKDVTYRGKISYSKKYDTYYAILMDERKDSVLHINNPYKD